jgi:mono/diheme cytochrome c family protein
MKLSSKLLPRPKRGRYLLVFASLYSLAGPAAQAQNIDEGKSASRLFADSCATCHRSAARLAKGRFRPALFLFLQDHYTSSSSAAWALASYLASVDTPQRGRSRAGGSRSETSKGRSPARPPAAVPSAQSN